MGQVFLKNIGDRIEELNWGDLNFRLAPGEKTYAIPAPMARKFTLRNKNLKVIDASIGHQSKDVSKVDAPMVQDGMIKNDNEADFDLNKIDPKELNKNINRVGATPRINSVHRGNNGASR